MKVTIEVSDSIQAIEMLKADCYVSLLEDFWAWLDGPGKESSAQDIRDKLRALAPIHHVVMT